MPSTSHQPSCSLAHILGHHLKLRGTFVGLSIAARVARWRGSPHLPSFSLTVVYVSPPLPSCLFPGKWLFLSPFTYMLTPDLGPQPLSQFSPLPCGFQNPFSWILFLAYERLRPLAPLEEPKPKPDASLCLICKMDIMTNKERTKSDQVFTRLSRHHYPSSQKKRWKTPTAERTGLLLPTPSLIFQLQLCY